MTAVEYDEVTLIGGVSLGGKWCAGVSGNLPANKEGYGRTMHGGRGSNKTKSFIKLRARSGMAWFNVHTDGRTARKKVREGSGVPGEEAVSEAGKYFRWLRRERVGARAGGKLLK